MYRPLPPRPKKTNIVRSRNGCKSCRQRKTKCDEEQPTCGTCARLGKVCESYRPDFKFRSMNVTSSKIPSARTESSPNHMQLLEDVDLSKQAESYLPRIGNINVTKSLQHLDRDVFYSTIWEDCCLPTMHPMFQTLSTKFGNHSMFRDATLALSSCNFSRLHPEKRDSKNGHMGSLSPNLVHQTRSQLYYSSAIHKFTALSESDCRTNTTMVLTVLTVFAYIESSMGNFKGFYCHDQGMSSLLLQLKVSSQDSIIDALFAAWIQIRILVWWARAYFCSLSVQQHLPAVVLPSIYEEAFTSLQGRRVIVLTIMCESHRLNFRTLMRHWHQRETTNYTNEQQWKKTDDLETTCHMLAKQGEKLELWLKQLPPNELPIQSQNALQEDGETSLTREPTYFHSHEAALNFAYYVVARIMQCTGLLQSLESSNPTCDTYECHKEDAWVQLLLRIVEGINMQTALTMNNYTIGFSGLLLTALLRCQSRSLGLEIQGWLQRLEDLKPTEEGAFPLYQTLGVVKAINQQKALHRDIFGATQPVDDDGGTPKFTSYNSQPISSLLLHGIDRTTGEISTECVSIDL